MRDRRDRGKSFAAKAQRRHRFEILRARELAGRVTESGEFELRGGNAVPVVENFDTLGAPAFEHNGHARRAGIDRVLDQLFDDRLRAFDNLAGRNLSHGDGIEKMDRGRVHAGVFARQADFPRGG